MQQEEQHYQRRTAPLAANKRAENGRWQQVPVRKRCNKSPSRSCPSRSCPQPQSLRTLTLTAPLPALPPALPRSPPGFTIPMCCCDASDAGDACEAAPIRRLSSWPRLGRRRMPRPLLAGLAATAAACIRLAMPHQSLAGAAAEPRPPWGSYNLWVCQNSSGLPLANRVPTNKTSQSASSAIS